MKRRVLAGKLQSYYRRLFKRYGPQHWWPGDDPFEVIIGAILTQNTAWQNVEQAVRNLKEAGLLTPAALLRVPTRKLARLIRPSGYFNIKATRLKELVRFLFDEYEGSVRRMCEEDLTCLRKKLLNVKGVGPETADSILLYAGGFPVFVVDAYTRRVFHRHGLAHRETDYHDLQALIISALPKDPALFNEFHALIVKVGKEHCGREPDCGGCPLKVFLEGKPPISW